MTNQEELPAKISLASAPPGGVSAALPASAKLLWDSWMVFKNRWHVFAAIAAIAFIGNAIYMLIASLAGAPSAGVFVANPSWLGAFLFLISLAFLIANIVLQVWVAATMICAVKDRGEKLTIQGILLRAWPKLAGFAWVALLVVLCVSAGLLLLIIPGIILAIWFCFSLNVFVDEGLKGRQALQRSRQLTKGKWAKTFWRFFIFLLFAVAIIILPDFIAWLTNVGLIEQIGGMAVWIFLMPFTTIYGYLLYEAAKQTQPTKDS